MVDSCSQKLFSVLSDLSGLLRRHQPLPSLTGDQGRERGKFGPRGVTKSGQFFLTEVLKFAKEVVTRASGDGVEQRQPFDEEVCGIF